MSQINVTSDLIFQTDQAQQNLRGFDTLLMETLRRWSQQSINLQVNAPNLDQVRRDLEQLREAASRAPAGRGGGGRITDDGRSPQDQIWIDPGGRRVGAAVGDAGMRDFVPAFHRETANFVTEFRRVAQQHAQEMERVLSRARPGGARRAPRRQDDDERDPPGFREGNQVPADGAEPPGLGQLARQLRRTAVAGLAINAVGRVAEGTTALGEAQNVQDGNVASLATRRTLQSDQAVRGMVQGLVPIVGQMLTSVYDVARSSINFASGNGFVSDEFLLKRQAQMQELQQSAVHQSNVGRLEVQGLRTYNPLRQPEIRRKEAQENIEYELEQNALYFDSEGKNYTQLGSLRKQQMEQRADAQSRRERIDAGREEALRNAALDRELQQQEFETGLRNRGRSSSGPDIVGPGNLRLAAQGMTRLAEMRAAQQAITDQQEKLSDEYEAVKNTDSPEKQRAKQRLDAFNQSVPVRIKAIRDSESLRVDTGLFQGNRAVEAMGIQATGSQMASTFAGFNSQARSETFTLEKTEHDDALRDISRQRLRGESAALLAQADRTNWERNLAAQVKVEATTHGDYAAQKLQVDRTYVEQSRRLNDAIGQNEKMIRSGRGTDEKPLTNEDLNRLREQQKRLKEESNTLDAQYNADTKALNVGRTNQLRALDAQNAVRAASVFGSSFDAQSMAVVARRQTSIDAAKGDPELIARANQEAQLDQALVNRSRRYRLEDLGAQTGEQHLLRMSGRTAAADTLEGVRQSLRDVNEAGTDRQLRNATADAAKAQLQEQMFAVGKFQFANSAESLWQIAAQSASDKTDVIRAGQRGLRQLDTARNMTDDQIRRDRGQDLPGGFSPPGAPLAAHHGNPRGLGHDRDARDNNLSIGRLAEALEKLIDKLHKHEV